MKLVKFYDGTYGVRKWTLFGYEYADLTNSNTHWWGKNCMFFSGCKIEDKEKAIAFINRAKHEVIDLDEDKEATDNITRAKRIRAAFTGELF